MAKIKDKLLYFGQNCGLTKTELAHRLGISKSNFVGESMNSDVSSGILTRFCQEFPTVSAEWLLRDSGPMVITGEQNITFQDNAGSGAMVNGVNNGTVSKQEGSCEDCALLKAKDETIAAQRIAIEALNRR